MGKAERLKILLADEKKQRILDCGYRSRIVAAVEYGQFSDRTPRTIDTEYLLAATRGRLENADLTALDDVHPGAKFPFAEDQLSGGKLAGNHALREKREFGIRQASEQSGLG